MLRASLSSSLVYTYMLNDMSIHVSRRFGSLKICMALNSYKSQSLLLMAITAQAPRATIRTPPMISH